MTDLLEVLTYYILSTALHPTHDIISSTGGVVHSGVAPTPADSWLDNATQTCLTLWKSNDALAIENPGYEEQYRIREDFEFTAEIISRQDQQFVDNLAANLEGLLTADNGEISVALGATTYFILIDSVSGKAEYKPDTVFWIASLVVKGKYWGKKI